MNNIKKFISCFLILAFLSTSVLTSYVNAASNTGIDTTIKNVSHKNEAIAKLNNAETKAYEKIISSISSFAKATKRDRDIIAKQLGIKYNLLIEAEQKGYSKADSILVAEITTYAKLSYNEIKESLTYYKDLGSLFCASKQYANLIKGTKFSANTLKNIKACLIKGYDIINIDKPSVIADIFNVNLCDIIAEKQELFDISSYSKDCSREEINELYSFASQNNISLQWFLEYTKLRNIEWKAFYQKVSDYYKKINKTITRDNSNLKSNNYSLTSGSNPSETEYKAPFKYMEYGEDKVELNTGSLEIENIDAFLPGKNGLDFKLVSRYNSGKQVVGEVELIPAGTSYYTYNIYIKADVYNKDTHMMSIVGLNWMEYRNITDEDYIRINQLFKDRLSWDDGGNNIYFFYIDSKNYNRVEENCYIMRTFYTPTYYQKNSPLGSGWNFIFDSIEVVDGNEYFNYKYNSIATLKNRYIGKSLHLKNGQIYRIDDNLKLSGYNLNDMSLQQDTSYTNGQGIQSYYVLKYKDGIKKYFAQDGRLLAKIDRYNNTIQYQHTLIRNHPVVTKIIDSLGRQVTINYNFSNKQVVVTAPNNKQVIYSLQSDSAFILTDHTVPNGEITEYGYIVTGRKDMENRETKYEYSRQVLDVIEDYTSCPTPFTNILSKIVYPTGSYTKYEYNDVYSFVNGSVESHPSVFKRTMVDATKNKTNTKDYKFLKNYTKYPLTKYDSDYFNLQKIYNEPYSIIINENNNTFKAFDYKFNDKNELVEQGSFLNCAYERNGIFETAINKHYPFESVEYKYDSNDHQLIQEKTKKFYVPVALDYSPYTNKELLSVEDYKYDQYGNLIKYWGPEAARDLSFNLTNPENDNHLVKYTYDTGYYHLLTQKEYKKDVNTNIVELNNLTYDRRNINDTIVKSNDIQNAKTVYEYDTWNNISSEKKYTKESGWTKYIETLFNYQDNVTRNSGNNFSGAYLTKKTVTGVNNADGTSEGTVEENYKYDDYGNKAEYMDPKGNTTHFQYDGLGRVKLKTNPDNSTVAYNYDHINNHLTVTDERGTQIKYIYNGFGDLLYQQDVATGQNLKTYEYNNDFNLEYEYNNTTSNNYYKTQYCYNVYGKLIGKIARDKNGTII